MPTLYNPWIIQGGISKSGSSNTTYFPKEMLNTFYFVSTMARNTSGNYGVNAYNLTTSSMTVNNSASSVTDQWWMIQGFAKV